MTDPPVDPGKTEEPKPLDALPPASDAARDLAASLAQIRIKAWMTVFRFLFGGAFIILAFALIVLTHLKATAGCFTEGFPEDAWKIFWALLFAGAAFAGKEIVEGIKTGLGLGGGGSSDSG